jgi:hypothetical protein
MNDKWQFRWSSLLSSSDKFSIRILNSWFDNVVQAVAEVGSRLIIDSWKRRNGNSNKPNNFEPSSFSFDYQDTNTI